MRADRLVATLLFLQAKGQATAAEVADELEVSVRTARRDLEALSIAGVPVYSTAGKGGGWSLVGGARTDLTGLSAPEAQALMLMTGSAPSATPELRAAVRKVVQALPESFRAEAEAATDSVVVDPSRWGHQRPADGEPPHLSALQDAVIKGRQIELGYRTPGKEPSTRLVHPLGLIIKASVWYLVAGTDAGLRTFRASRVSDVQLLEGLVDKPPDFDLEATWESLQSRFDTRGGGAVAEALATPQIMKPLAGMLSSRLTIGEVDPDGRTRVTITGPSEFILSVDLAAFGADLEVLEPPGVRAELARIGRDLVSLYG